MIQFSFFLLLAALAYYIVKPKNTKHLWISVISIPIVGLFLFGGLSYLYYFTKLNILNFVPTESTKRIFIFKLMRGAINELIYSVVAAGVLIYFLLKEKLNKNSKLKLPYFLIGVSVVTFIIPLSKELKTKMIRDAISKSYFEEKKESEKQKPVELKIFSYEGLSFSYPSNWNVEKNVITENQVYEIICEEQGYSFNAIAFTLVKKASSLDMSDFMSEMVVGMISHLKTVSNNDFKQGDEYWHKFKNIDAYTVDYDYDFFGQRLFGRYYGFKQGSTIVMIAKESESPEQLDTDFKCFEDSFELIY